MEATISALSENAINISLGNIISPQLNKSIQELAGAIAADPFEGFREALPAYSSLAVFYDAIAVRKSRPEFPSAFECVKNFVDMRIGQLKESIEKPSRTVEVPARFDAGFALDLNELASAKGLSPNEVIEIFLSKIYRVYMLGFLPGFAYMGEVDERIAMPRRDSPRLKVPKGSIGIAGRQTGIYPLDSPGGWRIIGKTDLELFTPDNEFPSFFRAGDLVKFQRA